MHEAVAGNDPRVVARPRALPRDVLVPLARRVVARRLRERSSDDGQWFLHGRSDDTIKVAGKRLGPAEVETVVVGASRGPGGGRGRPARRAEGRGVVGVRRARGRASTPTTRCATSCAARVADAARARRSNPSAIRFTDALPKTRSAKVLRRADPRDRHRHAARRPVRPRGSGRARCDRGGALRCTELIGCAGAAAAAAARGLGRVARGAACGAATGWNVGAAARAGQRRSGARPRGVPRPLRRVGAPAPLRRGVRLRPVPPRRPLRGRGEPRQRAARSVPDGVRRLLDRRGAARATGTCPKASCCCMRYAFEALRLHRLEAAIVPRNAPSRRVAEKLGLRDEGIALRFLQIQGVYEDHVRYAMTIEEWKARGHELVARYAHLNTRSSSASGVGTSPGRATRPGARPRARARSSKSGCHGTSRERLLRRREQRLRDARGAGRELARRGRGARRRGRSATRARSPRRGRRRAARRTARSRPRPAGRPPVRASTCGRRRGAGRSAGTARRSARDVAARRTSQASARFMPGADRGAVDGRDRRERRAQHAEEPFVDRHDAAAFARRFRSAASAPRLDDVGAASRTRAPRR